MFDNGWFQGSLLDMIETDTTEAVGSLGAEVERIPLTDGAWIDLRRTWITGADDLFTRLLTTVPWRAERRMMYERMVDVPRLLCFYDDGENLPDPLLAEARTTLNHHYAPELGEPFTSAGLCLYRDGRDSVAWHGDTIGRGSTQDTMVAILSLGTPPRPRPPPPRRRRKHIALRGRPRRPAGDGRQLPAHLGARGAEVVEAAGPAHQRAVPAQGSAMRTKKRAHIS